MKIISTRKELAELYKLHPQTIGKRLKELGFINKKRLTPKEVKRVYEEFGEPC